MSTIRFDSVFKLPVAERIQLVEAIWDSVAADTSGTPLEAWQAEELDRRLADFNANPTEGISLAQLRQKLMDD